MSDLATLRPAGSGNATVPGDACIQPGQAFVDNIGGLTTSMLTGSIFDLSSKGITNFVVGTNTSLIGSILSKFVTDHEGFVLNLSGNNIADAAKIGTLLTDLSALAGPSAIDISGGTMAVPPADMAVVAGAGSAGANGSYSRRGTHNGKSFYNLVGQGDEPQTNAISWDGSKWTIYADGITDYYESTDDTQFPWEAGFTPGGGSGGDPNPTVSGANAAKAALIYGGATVTTN